MSIFTFRRRYHRLRRHFGIPRKEYGRVRPADRNERIADWITFGLLTAAVCAGMTIAYLRISNWD